MGLALAAAGDQAGPGVLGLDSVAEPVGAGRRARLIAQRLSQPGRMVRPVGVGAVAVADLLGQVLGQVADTPGGILDPASTPSALNWSPNRATWWGWSPKLVEGLVPGSQDFPRGRVEVVAGVLVPDRSSSRSYRTVLEAGHQTWW